MTKRPTINEYFMDLAHEIKKRSEDLFFQCGCVFIHTESKHIISTGFNGLVPGADENLVDRTDRDARRPYMLHAEKNAILHCTKSPIFIGHCTAYVTSEPCFNCFQDMIAYGIKTVIYDRTNPLSSFYDDDKARISNLLNHCKDIRLIGYKK